MNTYTFRNDPLVEHYIGIKKAAEITGYSVSYIRHLVWKRTIPFYKNGKIGGKGAVRFKASELQKWMGSMLEKSEPF